MSITLELEVLGQGFGSSLLEVMPPMVYGKKVSIFQNF